LSKLAILSFWISLLVCTVLNAITIFNRTSVENLKLEQLVLEKSLRISEVISNLAYEAHSDKLNSASIIAVLDKAELETISSNGYSYELSILWPDRSEREILAAGELNKPGSKFIERHIQIHQTDLYLRVFPIHVWYSYPENLVLVIVGIALSYLIFFIMQNNFELKRMRGVYETMAKMDVLTAIYNRRYVEENLKPIINTISRSHGELSLLMIDVDFFKKYNDTYGHGKGDNCLKTVAGCLAMSLFREEDFVARYGGEEFVVVLPLCNERGAQKVAERLLKNIRDCAIPHEKNEVADCVTVSIGVTTGKADHSLGGNEYIKKADEALYMSKQNGRNQYTFLPFP
jgi:diguanylate cyclase (GGDEF)-like protein